MLVYVLMSTDTQQPTPWFVTGFAERESTFTYSRSRRGLSLYFGIQFKTEDSALLRRIRRFFGEAGTIYPRRAPGETRRSAAVAYYYRVTRIEELLRIVTHFDLYPFQGSKRDSFEVWREMVVLKAGPDPVEASRLDLLAAQLSALVPAGRSRTR